MNELAYIKGWDKENKVELYFEHERYNSNMSLKANLKRFFELHKDCDYAVVVATDGEREYFADRESYGA